MASAIAAIAQCAASENADDTTTLDAAAANLRALLKSQETDPLLQAKSGPEPSAGPKPTVESVQPGAAETNTAQWSFDKQLVDEFVADATDRIAAAEAAILELEFHPENSEAVHTVLRAFHTLKGVSGFLELPAIQNLAHHAENLLIRARDAEIRITGKYANLALECCDTIKVLIEDLKSGTPGRELVAPDNLPALIKALSEHGPTPAQSEALPEGSKSSAFRLVQKEAEVPPTDRLPAGATANRGQGADATGQTDSSSRVIEPAPQIPAEKTSSAPRTSTTSDDGSLRVSTQRLNTLLDLVGELVIAQSILARDVKMTGGDNARAIQSVTHAGKIVRQLQDLTMSLRMVPLTRTFHKLARLVRDLSQKSGKPIQFQTHGEETEIDRTMVETLNDPLVHLIRNAVDHGIESASDSRFPRQAARRFVEPPRLSRRR